MQIDAQLNQLLVRFTENVSPAEFHSVGISIDGEQALSLIAMMASRLDKDGVEGIRISFNLGAKDVAFILGQ